MKLIMMEDMNEGKGLERPYKVNMVDVGKVSSEGEGWMKEIKDFLRESILPKDKVKARKNKFRATRYTIVREVLYRKSFSCPLLRCLTENKAIEVLNTIHSGGRSLAHKAITTRYFWPYMLKDTEKFVKRCKKC